MAHGYLLTPLNTIFFEPSCRLADMYNTEMEAWHNEILSRVETTEDRKNKIREKAYALKARK
jgi:hypothetical protein